MKVIRFYVEYHRGIPTIKMVAGFSWYEKERVEIGYQLQEEVYLPVGVKRR